MRTPSGALVISELHMDGSRERKTFAPGYGEFFTSGGGDTEALALAVPTDAAEWRNARCGAEARQSRDHGVRRGDARRRGRDRPGSEVRHWWRGGRWAGGEVPRLLRPLLERAVLRLGAAEDPEGAAQAAIGLARLTQDLRLRHRSADAVDLLRLDTWLAQMLLDLRQRRRRGRARGLLRDRLRPRPGACLASARDSEREVDLALEELLDAINEGDLGSVREAARELRHLIR